MACCKKIKDWCKKIKSKCCTHKNQNNIDEDCCNQCKTDKCEVIEFIKGEEKDCCPVLKYVIGLAVVVIILCAFYALCIWKNPCPTDNQSDQCHHGKDVKLNFSYDNPKIELTLDGKQHNHSYDFRKDCFWIFIAILSFIAIILGLKNHERASKEERLADFVLEYQKQENKHEEKLKELRREEGNV